MKKIHSLLIAICASAVLLPLAISTSAAQESTARKSENSQPADRKAITPHNHMRDAKGMSISTKQSQSQDKAAPTTDKESMAATPDSEKVKVAKKKPRPHSHPQDAKGM